MNPSEYSRYLAEYDLLIALITIRSTTAVALKAREVLISTQLPSYQERAVQMESVLKMSITSGYYGESSINRG